MHVIFFTPDQQNCANTNLVSHAVPFSRSGTDCHAYQNMIASPHPQQTTLRPTTTAPKTPPSYYHVYQKPPGDEDEALAIELADEIRCDVCTVITSHVMEKFALLPTAEEQVGNSTSAGGQQVTTADEKRGEQVPPTFDYVVRINNDMLCIQYRNSWTGWPVEFVRSLSTSSDQMFHSYELRCDVP